MAGPGGDDGRPAAVDQPPQLGQLRADLAEHLRLELGQVAEGAVHPPAVLVALLPGLLPSPNDPDGDHLHGHMQRQVLPLRPVGTPVADPGHQAGRGDQLLARGALGHSRPREVGLSGSPSILLRFTASPSRHTPRRRVPRNVPFIRGPRCQVGLAEDLPRAVGPGRLLAGVPGSSVNRRQGGWLSGRCRRASASGVASGSGPRG
jgi:hypothetical protein